MIPDASLTISIMLEKIQDVFSITRVWLKRLRKSFAGQRNGTGGKREGR
jgi:hypothetical protein